MDSHHDPSSDEEKPEMTESEYEDLVWLTKKEVRSKLDKWRKEPAQSQESTVLGEDADTERSCRTCYFGSYNREVNKIWYVRCTLNEPLWRVVEDDLQCWKPKRK